MNFKLDEIVFSLFILVAKSLICCLQLRFSSVFIPRYFIQFEECSFCPLRISFKQTYFLFLADLNIKTSVLLIFKQFLYVANLLHFSNLSQLQYSFFSLNCCNLKVLYQLQNDKLRNI